MAAAGGPPLHELSADEARLVSAGMADLYPEGPDIDEVRDLEIPSSDGAAIKARLMKPSATPRGLLVYYHGGGWVLSDIDR